MTRIKIMYKEKKFNHEGNTIKYMLDKVKDSNDLIVVFSGIPRPGIKARYNNNRTLQNVKANRLFILDDLGYDGRGGYYLGKDKDFFMERAVLDLIKKIKEDMGIKKTVYCGSSKGGWAAFYFGIEDSGSDVIAGTLQYKMGNFVTRNERIRENLMKYVMGKNYTSDDIEYLNCLLKNKLEKFKANNCNIHLHYSDSEYTYEDHMIHLINDLKNAGIEYSADIHHYEKHADLSLYYPRFLLEKVNSVLSEKQSIS